MNISHALSDFLFDKKYFVSLFEDSLFIYQYVDLKTLSSTKIIIKMENFDLIINGSNLCINQMNKEELLIKGQVIGVKKEYE